ncbi:MAG TPA: hypothetical protein VGS21_04720 [Acidimicrobiales bacterium]|nr:hypothetical protein [Acidimicrobiales bacterium]
MVLVFLALLGAYIGVAIVLSVNAGVPRRALALWAYGLLIVAAPAFAARAVKRRRGWSLRSAITLAASISVALQVPLVFVAVVAFPM